MKILSHKIDQVHMKIWNRVNASRALNLKVTVYDSIYVKLMYSSGERTKHALREKI